MRQVLDEAVYWKERYEEAMKMVERRDPVFKTAMALWKIEQIWRDTAGGVILEDEDIVAKHYEAERAFEEACRKAEEVGRG